MEDAIQNGSEILGLESYSHQGRCKHVVAEKKRDVFVNLPTGIGKSSLYQFMYSCLWCFRPCGALLRNPVVIVIYPLPILFRLFY